MLIELDELQAARAGRHFGRIETAARTADVSAGMIRKLLEQGKLTRYKLGAATLVNLDELIGLIQPEAK